MYRKDDTNQLKFKDFYLPFSGQLRSDNRWVVLSKHIPWDKIEQAYSANFSGSKVGCPAKSARIALHYLQVTEDHYKRAVKVAQNPAQYLQETARNDSKENKLLEVLKVISPEIYRSLRLLTNSCESNNLSLLPPKGTRNAIYCRIYKRKIAVQFYIF